MASPTLPSESFQHARTEGSAALNQDSHRLSPLRHSRGWKPLMHSVPASTFLHPFAPRALPRFLATTGALTPARLALYTHARGDENQPFTGQVFPGSHDTTFRTFRLRPPDVHHSSFCCPPSVMVSPDSAPADSGCGLRLHLGSSSLTPAQSSSSSCGLHVRLRLLPTPPRGDSVTFGCRERTSPGKGLPPLGSRLLPGALGRDAHPDTLCARMSGMADLQSSRYLDILRSYHQASVR